VINDQQHGGQAAAAPHSTAVRVALWRALHVQVDARPHVIEDEIGLQLAAPNADWRQRPDTNAGAIRGYRAAIVGRARLIEDLDRPVAIESRLAGPIVGELRSRIEIRLTFAERKAVEQRAAASGLNSNRGSWRWSARN
jgi:leucine carboxyl methyltransferase